MSPGSGVLRAVFTTVVVLVAAVIIGYCVLVAVWVLSTLGSPGVSTVDVFWPAMALCLVTLVAIAGVFIQLRWANRGANAGAVARRSLLALAGPGAVILLFALAATW